MPTTLSPADELGPVLAGRSAAAVLRARVERLAEQGPVVVDFAGVVAASPSFADEFFAKLEPQTSAEAITFINVSPSLNAIARFVTHGRHGAIH